MSNSQTHGYPLRSLANSKSDNDHISSRESSDMQQSLEIKQHRFPSKPDVRPPHFTVNLAQSPEDRYTHMVPAFSSQFKSLPKLYDEILCDILPPWLASIVKRASALLLRGLYEKEETQELRGISRASGVPMYLLVAFNVLLDLFMGCTSGGVRVRDPDHYKDDNQGSKILHFRALDWGMDPLRHLVAEIDFIREENGPVVATSVTYFGYVGVLTGVRRGLSMSLNFRPHHDTSTPARQRSYVVHLLLVLFGYRRSISSVLRGYLLRSSDKEQDLDALIEDLKDKSSTAAYLIFSDGKKTVNVEKDNYSSKITTETGFLVTLNHDLADETKSDSLARAVEEDKEVITATGMQDLVVGSVERKRSSRGLYERALRLRREHKFLESNLEEEEIVGWMESDKIVNEETHYGVIMDPKYGRIIWLQRWLEPIDLDLTYHDRRLTQQKFEKRALAKLGRRKPYLGTDS